jgi:hypothetical protein
MATTYLRPTAACFLLERHNKNALTAMATPQSRIEPGRRVVSWASMCVCACRMDRFCSAYPDCLDAFHASAVIR